MATFTEVAIPGFAELTLSLPQCSAIEPATARLRARGIGYSALHSSIPTLST